jgi:sterol desaturase/sphingolipid hydroxylase (fatty acid hydroxylase superfamily)
MDLMNSAKLSFWSSFEYFVDPLVGRFGFLCLGLHLTVLSLLFLLLPQKNWHDKNDLQDSFFKTVFPAKIYLSRVFFMEVIYMISFGMFIMLPLWSFKSDMIRTYFTPFLREKLSFLQQVSFNYNGQLEYPYIVIWGISFGLFTLFLKDAASYFYHRVLHTSPFLWSFHRVHHSTTHITPVSSFRFHFVESSIDVFTLTTVVVVAEVFFLSLIGSFSLDEMNQIQAVSLFSVYPFYRIIMNMRHLHLRLSFGNFFDKLIVSPAYHHIHHAKGAEKKNYARIFPLFDIIFKTHVAPSEKLQYEIGINEGNVHTDMNSFLFEPFYYLRKKYFKKD